MVSGECPSANTRKIAVSAHLAAAYLGVLEACPCAAVSSSIESAINSARPSRKPCTELSSMFDSHGLSNSPFLKNSLIFTCFKALHGSGRILTPRSWGGLLGTLIITACGGQFFHSRLCLPTCPIATLILPFSSLPADLGVVGTVLCVRSG